MNPYQLYPFVAVAEINGPTIKEAAEGAGSLLQYGTAGLAVILVVLVGFWAFRVIAALTKHHGEQQDKFITLLRQKDEQTAKVAQTLTEVQIRTSEALANHQTTIVQKVDSINSEVRRLSDAVRQSSDHAGT